ncbi:MAG: NAD(P)-binding domain-containing protein [Pseudomonadota bacterium]|nr:NAD(P)-binding domain-containing protein [Pseudomonadota bacterium]
MKIAIIGAGSVGRALGGVWAVAGHDIHYGVRDPDEAKSIAAVGATPGSRARHTAEAVAGADVVVIATHWGQTKEALASAGDLTGKIVIDVTNPLRPDFSDLEEGYSVSGGERVAEWAVGARVYKAFNTTAAENMADAGRYASRPVMFVAGDEPEGKRAVMALVAAAGFEGVDAGPLISSRLLEPLAMLYIRVAFTTPLGRDYALAVLRPAAGSS